MEIVQLWENAISVSGEILERALRNNGLVLAAVHLCEAPARLNGKPEYEPPKRQLKLVFKSKAVLDSGEIESQEFSEEQIAEVRGVLSRTFKFCHARFFSGPVSNIQVALLQPANENPARQITVRGGVIQVVSTKDLTPEEREKDVMRNLAARLAGRV